jgi:hypothetical protein
MALITGLLSYISHAVVQLNNQVSALVERSDWHRASIKALEERMTKMEEHRRRNA